MRIAAEYGAGLVFPAVSHRFATVADSSSNASTYIIGAVASVAIGGGIYYYSSSLKVCHCRCVTRIEEPHLPGRVGHFES